MKAIAALYEEWMEVMEDYATVFSADAQGGVPALMSADDVSSAVQSGKSFSVYLCICL